MHTTNQCGCDKGLPAENDGRYWFGKCDNDIIRFGFSSCFFFYQLLTVYTWDI